MGAKILVVEDDRFLIGAYKAKLEKEGFEVKTASDGEEALKVLETYVPQVIIMDLVMPRKDGYTTLAEIKQIDNRKDIPIIVASNLGQSDEVQKAKELGAADFVSKSSLSLSDLIKKINSYL